MKILQINTVFPNGSTGKIAQGINKECTKKGFTCKIAYRYYEKGMENLENTIEISNWLDCHIHNRLAKYTNLHGFFSKIVTKRFLKQVDKFKPDVIHLHNLHGNYIHLPTLLDYIKNRNIPIIWTLHDCWSFTGICSHFLMIKCDKWKLNCNNCPVNKTIFNNVHNIYAKKKQMFLGINNMHIVTPSKWLKEIVKCSFLGKYPTIVINNGIDLEVFKPTYQNIYEKYSIDYNKYIVLGVAFDWSIRKGLDVFKNLSNELDNNKYQIVLVGTNDEIDKTLPKNIISIHRTTNQVELASIYTAADVFFNPTREDNYPTVNMEALACGTPVITFNTGGSPEIIDLTCGIVLTDQNVNTIKKEIITICEKRFFKEEDCLKKARQFDAKIKYKEYVKLYENCTYNS